jgi:rhodanese-related sulfurtransferase
MRARQLLLLLVIGFMAWLTPISSCYAAGEPENPIERTKLGKYLTAVEAYAMWKSDPEQVKVLDVRTPEEYVYVGHAPMARNIPPKICKGHGSFTENCLDLSDNPDFFTEIKKYYDTSDTILVMSRSSAKAAEAVNLLAQRGFVDVYSIVDGFEANLIADTESAYLGNRAENHWKISGAPWTYELDAALVYLPDRVHGR